VKPQTVWDGTPREANELADALANNCECVVAQPDGNRLITCAAHAMVDQQRTLDGLLFARYMANRLVAEELGLTAESASQAVSQAGVPAQAPAA
jgi:hypothetical protein